MNYNLINFCEFDKYATKSYCAIHNESETKNLGDITKINEKLIADFDMMTWGSPCQDFSVAGKQEGAVWICKDCSHEYNPLEAHYTKRENCPNCNSINIDKSRSSLIVEGLRILREKLPKFSIYENVKNITGNKFISSFNLFIKELDEYGYNSYWKILDAKEYGIPQHRERVFVLSVRKEIDNGLFTFPVPFNKIPNMLQCLENEVDKNYMVSDSKVNQLFINNNYEINMDKPVVGTCHPKNDMSFATRNRVYSVTGVSPTLSATMYKDPPKIIKKLTDILDDDAELPILHNIYGGFKEKEPRIFNEFSPTIRTSAGGGHIPSVCTKDKTKVEKIIDQYEVRTLTPLECWKLMGFSDEDFYKAKNIGTSKMQLYKQAGNSIVTKVLVEIYKELQKAFPNDFKDGIKLSSFFSGIGAFEAALKEI